MTNLIALGLTRSSLEPAIYPTQGELYNNYTTDTAINVQRKQDKITYITNSSKEEPNIVLRQIRSGHHNTEILQH
jgi:hypothetical protein